MARKEDFRLISFDHAEKPVRSDGHTAWRRRAVPSRVVKWSVLVATAAAIALAILSMADPLAELLGDATAFLTGGSTPQDGTAQDMPIGQSSASTQALPPITNDAAADNDIARPSETASQGQIEITQAPTGALLGQFQAWAANRDGRAELQPLLPMQQDQTGSIASVDYPTQNARPEDFPVPQRRQAKRDKNVRVEIGPKPTARAKGRPDPNRPIYFQSGQVREPDAPPVQNTRPPSFLESFGVRN